MSLEGTLETIALPDVLALLSVTAKTGELRVQADVTRGSLWLEGGRIAGFEVGKNRTPLDALFALLRMRQGTFRFHTDGRAVNPVEPLEVGPVLEQAEGRLLEWPAILAVVPSLSSVLRLQPHVSEPVLLEPGQWRMIASIGGGRPVSEVLDAAELGEFDGCKAVKDLVDLKLVEIVPAGPAPASQTAAPALPGDDLPADDVPAAVEGDRASYSWSQDLRTGSAYDVHVGDEPAEEAGDAPEEVAEPVPAVDFSEDTWQEEGEEVEAPVPAGSAERGEPVNRGLLLKFLGSARN